MDISKRTKWLAQVSVLGAFIAMILACTDNSSTSTSTTTESSTSAYDHAAVSLPDSLHQNNQYDIAMQTR